MEFGEKLRQSREAKGMTQQKLADRLFVTRQAVSRWECGARYPDLMTAKCISDILEVSMDELLSGDEFREYSEKQSIMESGRAGKMQTLLYGVLSVLVFLNLAQSLIAAILTAASGELCFDSNLYSVSREVVFNGMLLCLSLFGILKSFRQEVTPKIVGLIGSIYYILNGIHYFVMPKIAGYEIGGFGSLCPLLLVSGFRFLYAAILWQFFANGKARLEKPVCLFGLFSITFAVVTAIVNVGGLFRDGLLTQFFYVSFDSLTSVTVLCVITAMTAYQARLLSRKRRRQQNMVNA